MSTIDDPPDRLDFLKGTLEVLILDSLQMTLNHAFGIAKFIELDHLPMEDAHSRWQETTADGNIPVATICRSNVPRVRAGSQMSLREQWAKLYGLFTGRRGLDNLHEEIETHLAMEIKDAQGTGSDPDDV